MFFNFQLSFKPMQGVKLYYHPLDEYVLKLSDAKHNEILFLNLMWKCNSSKKVRKTMTKSSFFRNYLLLHHMLNHTTNNVSDDYKLTTQEVVDIYARYYFEKYKETHKILPNPMMIAWLISIAITLVFYILLVLILCKISPLIALFMVSFNAMVFFFYTHKAFSRKSIISDISD